MPEATKSMKSYNFTQSFKSTVKRYDSLAAGKKADFSRSSAASSKSAEATSTSAKSKG